MAFWLREAQLTVGNNIFTLGAINFSFEVPFKDSDEPPVATIKIMNLSADTRASIKKGDDVILNAGYEGDVGCILTGAVVGLKHKQSNVDWTTTITVQSCAEQILNKRVNKTYKKKAKALSIVRDLLNLFGIEVSKLALAKNKSYSRGRVCRGKLKKILSEIVVTECKSRLIIRPTGQLFITKPGTGLDNGVTLSESNGLLRYDEEIETVAVEKSSSTASSTDISTIKRSCLLNHQISTAEMVLIEASDLNGKFYVTEGKHIGSLTGTWETEIELATPEDVKKAAKSSKKTYKVGSTGKFKGTKQYSSSSGTKSQSAKPGPAKITKISAKAKHPYYVVHTNKTSNVHGWVNKSDFT